MMRYELNERQWRALELCCRVRAEWSLEGSPHHSSSVALTAGHASDLEGASPGLEGLRARPSRPPAPPLHAIVADSQAKPSTPARV